MPARRKERTGHGQPAPSAAGAASAIRSPAVVAMFLAVAGISLAADLLSKYAAFESLLDDPALPQRIREFQARHGSDIPPDEVLQYLRIQRRLCHGVRLSLSTNPEGVFGLPMPKLAVGIATVATIVLIFYFFATSGRNARVVHTALAFILAGALGNLYDRLFSNVSLPGLEPIRYHVRDFIDCSELYYPWVFNIADALLVVGVAVLILHWWLAGRRAKIDN